MTLEEASEAKLERICRKLELGPGDHVLEIGTGWGAFAVYAAKHFGCRVTSTTISVEQYERACRRVEQAGVSDKVTLLLKDYRDLDGRYDKLVSIEMIEAVGNRFMPEFFRKCRSLLKPHGQMCLQSITIADQRYKAALRSVDFIQRYIFPGGFLPSLTALASSITENTDMRVSHVEDFGVHYGRTLEEWRNRFASRLPEIRRLGYSEEFLRMWHYYLCYCEGAFRERAIGVVQLVVEGPLVRREPLLGAINNRA
jgi:cyclopropane-fatty-acyl-phospholipid synthase